MNTYCSYFFIIVTVVVSTNRAFSQDDCGCGAALRYDYHKRESNYFTELLLARDLNQENYKEIIKKADGSLSLFGIKLGANGENIEKIKQIYQERTRFENTVQQMSKYESYTTSPTSFLVYGECMKNCLENKRRGLKAYKIQENRDEVSIDLYYLGEGGAAPAEVTYYSTPSNNPKQYKIKIPNNTFRNIRIKRESSEAFTVVFTYERDRSSLVAVNQYQPITALIPVTFKKNDTIQGSKRSYSVTTANNDNRGCGIIGSLIAKQTDGKMNVQFLRTLNDGGYLLPDCVADRRYSASRVVFKMSSENGYLLKNPDISCHGPVCGVFEQDKRYLINDPSLIIYIEKHFSLPVTVGFVAETYKLNQVIANSASFSNNDMISFIIPKTSLSSAILHGNGFNLSPGESKGNLIFDNQSVREDEVIFNYKLKSQAAILK